MDSLLMHAFAPITHVCSLSFGFLCSFSFSSLFAMFSFLSFYLSVFCFLFSVVPSLTVHDYNLLYCLS